MSVTMSQLRERAIAILNDVDQDRMYGIDMDVVNRLANPHPWEMNLEDLGKMLNSEIILPHLGSRNPVCLHCVLASQRRRRAQILAGQYEHDEHGSHGFSEDCDHCQWQIQTLDTQIATTQARIIQERIDWTQRGGVR